MASLDEQMDSASDFDPYSEEDQRRQRLLRGMKMSPAPVDGGEVPEDVEEVPSGSAEDVAPGLMGQLDRDPEKSPPPTRVPTPTTIPAPTTSSPITPKLGDFGIPQTEKLLQETKAQRDPSKIPSIIDDIAASAPKMAPEDKKAWDSRIRQARDLYDRAEERGAWGQVFGTLVDSLAQMAAGIQSSRIGLDIRGAVKTPQIDWERRADRNLRGLDQDLHDIEHERTSDQTERLRQYQTEKDSYDLTSKGRIQAAEREQGDLDRQIMHLEDRLTGQMTAKDRAATELLVDRMKDERARDISGDRINSAEERARIKATSAAAAAAERAKKPTAQDRAVVGGDTRSSRALDEAVGMGAQVHAMPGGKAKAKALQDLGKKLSDAGVPSNVTAVATKGAEGWTQALPLLQKQKEVLSSEGQEVVGRRAQGRSYATEQATGAQPTGGRDYEADIRRVSATDTSVPRADVIDAMKKAGKLPPDYQ